MKVLLFTVYLSSFVDFVSGEISNFVEKIFGYAFKEFIELIGDFLGFTYEEIANAFDKIRDSIVGAVKVISSLPEVLSVLYPFLHPEQIAYLVFLLVSSLVVAGYFFVKKVF